LLLDSNDEDVDNDQDDSVLDQAETRKVLNRARLRSIGLPSDATQSSINFENIRQSFRRPSRTISNLTSPDLQFLGRQDEEKLKGPRADVRLRSKESSLVRSDHRARKVSSMKSGDRVDAVMKAPPNMKGGLVVIRSYCRYPPEEFRRQYRCRNPTKFYYYNVSTATCEALSGVCTSAKNKFPTFESCMKSCIVKEDHIDE